MWLMTTALGGSMNAGFESGVSERDTGGNWVTEWGVTRERQLVEITQVREVKNRSEKFGATDSDYGRGRVYRVSSGDCARSGRRERDHAGGQFCPREDGPRTCGTVRTASGTDAVAESARRGFVCAIGRRIRRGVSPGGDARRGERAPATRRRAAGERADDGAVSGVVYCGRR